MNTRRIVSSGVLFLLVISRLVLAQGTPLPDADMKKLVDSLGRAFPWPGVQSDDKKRKEGRDDFGKELERISKANATPPLLSRMDVWGEIFAQQRVGMKAPAGLGGVVDKVVKRTTSGKAVEFHYGLYLPSNYDAKKRYGLIVALHDKPEKDKQTTGQKYLEEVWMNKGLPKADRDKFIIVAPTMGPNAGGKEIRIEWGDKYHFYNVYWPLTDVMTNYAVDTSRIYLDGTGDGGNFALLLATLRPHQWAGVAARNTVPKDTASLTNLENVPTTFHYRKGGAFATTVGLISALEQLKTVNGVPVTLKEYDPLPEAQERAAKGTQATDPIHDATTAIAAGFAEAVRTTAAKKLTYQTSDHMFDRAYWVRLITFDTAGQPAKVTGTVDSATNTIDLNVERVDELRLFLQDSIVDLTKPVKVMVNGKLNVEQKFERSIDELLKFYEKNNLDPYGAPTAILDVKIPLAAPETKPGDNPPKD